MLKKMTILKISILTLISITAVFYNGFNIKMMTALIEVHAVFLLAQLFGKRLKWLAYGLSSLAFFFIILNVGSHIVSGGYITYFMYNNLTNLSALGDALPIYFGVIIMTLVLSFLPMRFDLFENKLIQKIGIFYSIDLIYVMIFIVLNVTTPIGSFVALKTEIHQASEKIKFLEATKIEKSQILKKYERPALASGIETGVTNMNVIIIFAEGLSSHVLDINNDLKLNLTPRLDQFSKEAGVLNVKNYYNHTAATYKGLRGQLYSAYQYCNGTEKGETDGLYAMTDTPLISLPDILRDKGYVSSFINPEPEHVAFSNYLSTLGFDQVITGKKKELVKIWTDRILPDKNNYNLLFKKANELSQHEQPFLLSTYTFGSHVKLDGDKKYQDGKVKIYNRFHTMDAAFGQFWQAFKASNLYENTMVIVTSDHATYADPEYLKYFKANKNPFIDQVPLMIYYPRNTQQTMDAAGKNSLSLTPTILDLLGLESHANYFLGNSLFSNDVAPYQYISEIESDFFNTKQNDTVLNDKMIDDIMTFNKVSLNN